MKNRPLIFILIACAHLFEPLIKLAYFKYTTPFSIGTIITNISQISNFREIFEFWLLFPLGGLALLGVKKWSYPVFVGVQFYSIYSHLTYEKYTWPYVSEVPFISSIALLIINALIIIFFTLPDVRRPFFDRSIRWWEVRTRYHKSIPIFMNINEKEIKADILNISQSGAFIAHKGILENGQAITISINYNDFDMELNAIVRSGHTFGSERGIGVQFKFENIWENLYMRKIISQVRKDIKKERGHSKEQKLAA